MRSLNVRLALAILAVAVAVFVIENVIFQVVYIDTLGQRQSTSFELLDGFVHHPDYDEALAAMPEDLARTQTALRQQLGRSLDFIQLVRRWRWLFPALFLAVFAPLIIGLALFVSRRLTRPLRDVADAARRLARGDFTVRAQPRPASWDRTSLALAEDFNFMAASLERLNDERQSMIADIAHELRTPLTAIQLQLEAVQDGIDPLTPAVIDRLSDETRLLSRLIADLRTLSLAEAGQLSLDLEELDLHAFLESLRSSFEARAQTKDIALRLEGAMGVTVQADAERLRQIVGNLLSNALRHTPQGGEMTLGLEESGAWATISVKDTGPGLTEEALEHAFNRFYRSGKGRVRAEGGSGLGLAIVKALTELHGGRVGAENQAEGGALFRVALPLGLARAGLAGQPPSLRNPERSISRD